MKYTRLPDNYEFILASNSSMFPDMLNLYNRLVIIVGGAYSYDSYDIVDKYYVYMCTRTAKQLETDYLNTKHQWYGQMTIDCGPRSVLWNAISQHYYIPFVKTKGGWPVKRDHSHPTSDGWGDVDIRIDDSIPFGIVKFK